MDTARAAQSPGRRLTRVALVAVAGVGAIWCLWTTAGILRDGAPFALAKGTPQVALELGAAASIIVVGLVAFARRSPGGISGVGLGIVWLVREWANPAAPQAWMLTAGLLCAAVWLPIAARLALTHPLSYPLPLTSRAMLGLATVAALGPAAVRTATFDPAAAGCRSCAPNLLLVVDAPHVAVVADRVGVILQLITCLLLVGWVARSMILASTAVRLVRAPMAVASSALFAAVAIGCAGALIDGFGAHEAMRRTIGAQSLSLLAVAAAMVWDPLRLRLMRRRTARLVTELSSAPRPGGLRDELARLVGDATIALGFPLDDGRVVDESGREVAQPLLVAAQSQGGGRIRRSTTLLQRDGRPLVVLFHRPGLLDDGGYRETLTRASGLAIGNERLHAELATQVEDLRRSRAALVGSFDAERRRLERSLHDGAQQRAVSLLLALRLAASRQPDPFTAGAIAEVEAALDGLRELAHGLYPASLAEEGLGSALQELAERAAIPVRIVVAPDGRLPEQIETTGYAVISALAGQADVASVDVAAERSATELVISVRGRLTADSIERTDPVAGPALEDRIGAVGGTLASTIGAGHFEVRAVLPCVS